MVLTCILDAFAVVTLIIILWICLTCLVWKYLLTYYTYFSWWGVERYFKKCYSPVCWMLAWACPAWWLDSGAGNSVRLWIYRWWGGTVLITSSNIEPRVRKALYLGNKLWLLMCVQLNHYVCNKISKYECICFEQCALCTSMYEFLI